jgi:HAD superfamily hydrolase (TIGR01549 family)
VGRVVEAVVFDIGETLVDETRAWATHADALGYTHLTFFAALGAVIESRRHHRTVFELLGADPWVEPVPYERSDLYADAVPCVRRLRDAGYTIALVGNQPVQTEAFLRECGLDVDLVASSESWGVSKPDPAYFTRVAEWLGLPPERIAHVGDRVDNDVVPAVEAGMTAVFLRRGAWGHIQAHWPEAVRAHVRIESLDELPGVLA